MRTQAVVVLAAILSVALAFPDGAGVCTNSASDRSDVYTQMGTLTDVGNAGPFSLSFSPSTWYYNPNPDTDEAGADVEVTISGASGANFNGFLLYATDGSGNKAGQWLTTATQSVNGNLPAACKNMGHTLTHRDITAKGGTGGAFVATWRPPLSGLGTSAITFRGLLMVGGTPRSMYTFNSAAVSYQVTAPYEPKEPVATPRWKALSVAFRKAPNGGAAITYYEARAVPRTGGGPTVFGNSTFSPITIVGLTNGIVYDVNVRARNSIGFGAFTTNVATAAATPGCFCNGHSTTCNAQGVCQNCQGNTEGSLCDVCTAPYRGDPTVGDCGIPPNPSSAYAPAASLALIVSLIAALFL